MAFTKINYTYVDLSKIVRIEKPVAYNQNAMNDIVFHDVGGATFTVSMDNTQLQMLSLPG